MKQGMIAIVVLSVSLVGCESRSKERAELRLDQNMADFLKHMDSAGRAKDYGKGVDIDFTAKNIQTICASEEGLVYRYYDYALIIEDGAYKGIFQDGYNDIGKSGEFVSYDVAAIGENCQLHYQGLDTMLLQFEEQSQQRNDKIQADKKKREQEEQLKVMREKREKFERENPHIVALENLGSEIADLEMCVRYGFLHSELAVHEIDRRVAELKKSLGPKYDRSVVEGQYESDIRIENTVESIAEIYEISNKDSMLMHKPKCQEITANQVKSRF